ncbi:glutamate-ammonia-ligase adenylyltransferase [Allorhodopirellula heiligendammensis]|uniref:Glutamate-ammonia-ligase adenylyltransferase n=1 Tax=Allorhodopirellula heiligendammensis TaxID=2714739 RepID=A0A5C6C0T5_9BACT|nr:glutamate-ammonia-ligase adenylyltransferase [Allorhodopirellula heiligendammensis]TWU16784.1 Glutamate-ammonia-ligase adenylyltransferase [Allorhodopirellula heiligendammensis]
MTTAVNSFNDYHPLRENRFTDSARVLAALEKIAASGVAPDLLTGLWTSLHDHLGLVDDPDGAVQLLERFVDVSRSPTSLLALFDRDPQALPALLQVLSTSPAVAELLISDPESFDLIRASDGRPTSREQLRDELAHELRTTASIPRAAVAIRRYVGREVLRIAYGEFVRGLAPDRVARQISHLTDAVLATALDFTIDQVASQFNYPQRIDASEPKYAIIALGNYGGEEIGYDSPLDLLLLCDQIDRRNESHLKFNRHIVAGLLGLLGSNRGPVVSIHIRFVQQPGEDFATADTQRLSDFIRTGESASRQVDFHAASDAAAYYERENQTFQRLAFVKGRVAAGDRGLGDWFLKQMEPWVYHRLLSRSEIADIRVLRRKLEKRALSVDTQRGTPIADCPGGRRDIELTIQFLQLMHGGELPEVRVPGTLDAIAALNRHGCLTQQEASILSENHARLCRLEHHLAVLLDHRVAYLPDDDLIRTRLAWRLGVRRPRDRSGESGDGSDEKAAVGDRERFEKLLDETFDVNRKIINHLMAQDVAASPTAASDLAVRPVAAQSDLAPDIDAVEIETELILDPDPDSDRFAEVLRGHGFIDLDRAADQISSLSHESVSFLSPRRCRQFFAGLAPHLLREIARTPAPDRTLDQLSKVADSIGAKATLWELLGANPATLALMVNLCSLTPYLTGILTENPGMIDELVDSLLMNRLPPSERLDAQSIRLCQFADDLSPILQTFRAGCHLMIGTRDLLGKETVDAIGQSLSDTADACLRRVIDRELELLTARFGDPVNEQNEPVEMVAVALGKYGGREPNYHSDLDLTFLYTAEGETQRRVGGPKATLSNRQFFNQLAQNVVRTVDSAGDRLYEVDLPLAQGADETVLAYSIDQFIKPFRLGGAPLWRRAALCQARAFSGSRRTRELVSAAIAKAIRQTPWRDSQFAEFKTLRQRGESTAAPGNMKRGVGGTVDAQFIVAAGVLKSAGRLDAEIATGVAAALSDLAAAGVYDRADAEKLIDNYRYLRNVETKLRLIDTPARHELPLSADGKPDTLEMKQLAALLGESDPAEIVRRCDDVRVSNRSMFERMLAP